MPPSGGRSKNSILIIDEDPEVGRIARMAVPDLSVIVAQHPLEGLRVAARRKPDLIVMETQISGMNGLELAAKLRCAPETNVCALAILSTDRSLSARVEAMQIGAVTFLRKPTDASELSQQISAILDAQGELAAPLDDAGSRELLELVRDIERRRLSGTIELTRPDNSARIEFSEGQMTSARYKALSGLSAVDEVAATGRWIVEFLTGAEEGEQGEADGCAHPQGNPREVPAVTGPVVTPELLKQRLEAGDDAVSDGQGGEQLLTSAMEAPAGLAVPDLEPIAEYFDDEPTIEAPSGFDFASAHAPQTIDTGQKIATEPAPEGGSTLGRWLGAIGRPPLLVAISDPGVRRLLQLEFERIDLSVASVDNAAHAYYIARERRPVAVLCDARLPDADGRRLVAALRCDVLTRELPVLIVPGAELAVDVARRGQQVVKPVIEGLLTTLKPRRQLFDQLSAEEAEVSGWVDPIGINGVVGACSAAQASGLLSLRGPEQRQAEVGFLGGEITRVAVTAPYTCTGPLALVDLVGLEWQEFTFDRTAEQVANTSALGGAGQLLSRACRQNNALLALLYDRGLSIDGVSLDQRALDRYIHQQPPSSIDPLMRLAEGQPARELLGNAPLAELALRTVVHELRRHGAARLTSVEVVREEELSGAWITLEPKAPLAPRPEDTRRRRWPTVIVACLVTFGVAVGGLALFRWLVAT